MMCSAFVDASQGAKGESKWARVRLIVLSGGARPCTLAIYLHLERVKVGALDFMP